MKKTALYFVASAALALIASFDIGVANAGSKNYSIVTANGAAGTLDTARIDPNTNSFEFVDPSDTIVGFGAGTLQITGNYAEITDDADNVNATLTTGALVKKLITNGDGIFSISDTLPIFTISTDDDGRLLSYTTTSYADTASNNEFTFSTGGGSYTVPTPESSTLVSLGTLLCAGGLFLFATRRRSTSV